MRLKQWQELYVRAEDAARGFFGEHFNALCVRCYECAGEPGPYSCNCCQRADFAREVPESALLRGLAKLSFPRGVAELARPPGAVGCSALGPQGCRIAHGRPPVCNRHVCDDQADCLEFTLAPSDLSRLYQALNVFVEIVACEPGRDDEQFHDCAAAVTELESVLEMVSVLLRRDAGALVFGEARPRPRTLRLRGGRYP